MAHFFKPKKNRHDSVRNGSKMHALGIINKQHQQIKQLLITRLSDDGRGITSHNGKTFFVENSLPSEVVDAVVTTEKSTFYEGFATKTNHKSSYRRQPLCEHYADCGGCHLQHIDLAMQHDFKLKNILNKLMHVAKIVPQNILPPIIGEGYYYRQRARLSVAHINNKILLGFRKKNSKSLVDINECVVMIKPLADMIEPVRNWLNTHKPPVTHVEFINGEKHAGLIIRHVKPVSIPVREKLCELLEKFQVSCWFQANKNGILTTVDEQKCEPILSYTLNFSSKNINKNIFYLYHPQDFIQANAIVNQKMVNQAIFLLQPKKNEIILDLFCGIGNFSLPLSLSVKYVLGIEGSLKMTAQATSNALKNGCKNISFEQADLFNETAIDKLIDRAENIDSLILDPPRAGARMICQRINKLSPNKILYVSCDPNTFIRDAQLLAGNNYILQDFGIMDMFAQTYHNEVMGLFVLNRKSNIKPPKRKIE